MLHLKHRLWLAGFIIFLLFILGCGSSTSSKSKPGKVSEVRFLVNGQAAGANMPAVIVNGSTMVPIAFAAEYLGVNVNYESATKTVFMSEGGTQVKFLIDGKTYKNEKPAAPDMPATIKDGQILAPLNYVCQAFGASLSWNGASKTATITKNAGTTERQLPENGTIAKYYSGAADSGLKIGALSSDPVHYYVKLARWDTKEPVLTLFVRSGQNVLLQVPSGTYEIKYAAGEKWYGEKDLFGPDTIFARADTECELPSGGGLRFPIYQPGDSLFASKIQRSEF
ncbi:MAG: copper amine oxidase N-terminal domain-containing protein [Syntrophomonas sp.]